MASSDGSVSGMIPTLANISEDIDLRVQLFFFLASKEKEIFFVCFSDRSDAQLREKVYIVFSSTEMIKTEHLQTAVKLEVQNGMQNKK